MKGAGALFLAFALAGSLWAAPAGVDREPQPGEVSYQPAEGSSVSVNPPTFVWLPVEKAGHYVLQVSRSREFPADSTLRREAAISLEGLPAPLETGRWFWRYGAVLEGSQEPVFSQARSFEIPADAPRIPLPETRAVVQRLASLRPRLALRAGDLERFREQGRGEMAWAVAPVLAAARKEIGRPLLPEPSAAPPGEAHGAAYTRIFVSLRPDYDGMVTCAEAYLLAGDEACGQEARRRLLHFISWDPRGSTSLAVHDEQCTELVRKAALAYDYAYPLLTEAERSQCRDVLVDRMRQLYEALRAMPFEARPFRSHAMGYYVPDLTQACLALAGEAPVEEMLDYCLHLYWSPFYPPFGGADGGWSDGQLYWSWYWNDYARMCAVIERATGAPVGERPLTHHAALYKLYCNPPWSKLSPFGDGQALPADRPEAMYELGAWLRDPHALWYADQFHYRPSGLTAFLFPRGDLPARAPDDLPLARAFYDAGLVAMRSSMSDPARDVQLLMRSSPMGSMSHGYADQNAFALFAYGEPLAIESGYYDQSNGPHQRLWARTTKAANSITVDGEGQTPYKDAARGRIAGFASNGYAHYALGDAREAYLGRIETFDRHLLYLRPHGADEAMIVIYDDLAVAKPATFQWWLHALEEMQLERAGARATLRRGEARLRVQFLAPENLRFEQTDQFTAPPVTEVHSRQEFPNQWHLTVHADTPAQQQQFVTLLLPYRAGAEAALPEVRRLEGQHCHALELCTKTARHVVLLRRPGESGLMEAGGVTSGSAIFATGFDAEKVSFGSIEIPEAATDAANSPPAK